MSTNKYETDKKKKKKTLQFFEFLRDFMLFCSFFETANSPTLQSLSVLAPLWGFRQPGDFSGHIMKHDPLPCESVSELKPLQLFPAYSHITKKTNYKVIKLPSHWCSTLSMINTFFPVFYSAQEHPQAAPLSSVSSCLDGRIWGFGFESPPTCPKFFTALHVRDGL